jgi:hypothetical protein
METFISYLIRSKSLTLNLLLRCWAFLVRGVKRLARWLLFSGPHTPHIQ